MTLLADNLRMQLVGKDKEPLDLSQDKHLDVFMKSTQLWIQMMSENEDNSKVGYVDVVGMELESYGTPYASS